MIESIRECASKHLRSASEVARLAARQRALILDLASKQDPVDCIATETVAAAANTYGIDYIVVGFKFVFN